MYRNLLCRFGLSIFFNCVTDCAIGNCCFSAFSPIKPLQFDAPQRHAFRVSPSDAKL